jgi:hypothetical protein
MSQSDEDEFLSQRVRVNRILLGSLIAGPLIFMVIAVIVRQGMQGVPPDLPILTYLSFPFAIVNTTLSFFMPDYSIARERRKLAQGSGINNSSERQSSADFGRLVELYQTRMIIGAAMIEGCIFFFIIAYIVEGSLYCLVGALVLLGIMISKFPNREGVEQWVEKQRDLLQQERMGI